MSNKSIGYKNTYNLIYQDAILRLFCAGLYGSIGYYSLITEENSTTAQTNSKV